MKKFNINAIIFFLIAVAFSISNAFADSVATPKSFLLQSDPNDARLWKADPDQLKILRPDYPFGLLREGVSGCVSIGYFIEADGTTSGFKILNSIAMRESRGSRLSIKQKNQATSGFANSAVNYLKLNRYNPGPDNPERERVFRHATLRFYTDEKSVIENCEILDLSLFLKSVPKIDSVK